MSQYLILIYDDEAAWDSADERSSADMLEGHYAFGARHEKDVVGANALQPTATATSVRPDGSGGFTITDGPFVETKEALGGYYLVEAPDLDAAIAMARQIPVFSGGLEIRPILVHTTTAGTGGGNRP
ncbi:YciI family protein [Actinocorallia longicatena]|uniref:YciI family protein n=1 Tax=Actinocorallia longicatena TaxID=111803 RepID=A0ABP6QJ44_9ACTN